MQLTILLLLTAVLPLCWGWLSHWIVVRCWPPRDSPHAGPGPRDYGPPPFDYQI